MQMFQEVKQDLISSVKYSSNILNTLGDEINMHILRLLLESGKPGLRVPELTRTTFLSRPSVTHHLKMLMDAGVVGVQKIGTRNYYYVEVQNSTIQTLTSLVNSLISYRTNFPDMIDGKFEETD